MKIGRGKETGQTDKSSKRPFWYRLATGSFWLIMAVHLVVFTAIGLFTPAGWRLLLIFFCGLAILGTVLAPVVIYARKHPHSKWTAYVPLAKRKKRT